MTLTERLARAFYAYDNPGGDFGMAQPDALAPYWDLAEIALSEIEATS